MDSSVSAKDEIWLLRVCHHVSNALYISYEIIRHVNLLSDRRSLTEAWECHSIVYFVRELVFFSLMKYVTFVFVLEQVLCNHVIRSSKGGLSVLYSIFISNWLSNVWCPITSRYNGPLSVI